MPTLRWSGMDSNVQFRARWATVCGFVRVGSDGPAHGHPSSCRPRRTARVSGGGPGRRPSPPGSGGRHTKVALSAVRAHRGTEGSNPFPSTGEMLWGGGEDGNFVAYIDRWSAAMPQPNDLSRSLEALDQDSTIIAVVEMSQSSWLVGGVLPGIERQPRKKLEPNPERLLALLHSHPSCGAERR